MIHGYWMDGVKVALGNRGMMVDNERKIWRSGEPWCICNWRSFKLIFLLGPVFFRTTLPCSGGYHLERGGMPLHDAVGINCKKGTTTENQGAGVKYMGIGVYVWCLCVCVCVCVCVLSDLTWLLFLSWGRKSWYIIIIIINGVLQFTGYWYNNNILLLIYSYSASPAHSQAP